MRSCRPEHSPEHRSSGPEIIEELEHSKRGIYGGAIGYLDFTGNLDTCIAIRLVYKKKGEICIRSGAGIVADSVPEKEFEECCNKARPWFRQSHRHRRDWNDSTD